MQSKIVKLELFYEEEKINEKRTVFSGGIKTPDYIDELKFDIFEDAVYNEKLNDFESNGKYNINISGTNKSIYELGKYLINFAIYQTNDDDFHVHIDDICDSEGTPFINLIINKKKD